MIFITQGHERGVGLEVFFKALLCSPYKYLNNITLIASKEAVGCTLKSLSLDCSFSQNQLTISNFLSLHFIPIENSNKTQTTSSLDIAMGLVTPKDVLITLPTSKDQIFIHQKNVTGHTDYFREYFADTDISMMFRSPNHNLLLLSDHIQLEDVYKYISNTNVTKKIQTALNLFNKIKPIQQIILSGINPHNGEGGLLGNDFEILFSKLPDSIQNTPITFHPGDSIFNTNLNYEKTMIVSCFHDHGLTGFKSLNKFVGANITGGLPFIRMSPDHGTAFDLFQKSQANPTGMKYVLDLAYYFDRGRRESIYCSPSVTI